MTDAIFRREGDLFVPSGHTRGPWDPGAQHGGAPAALLADAVDGLAGAGGMAVARLTFEFLGPVALAPLAVAARVVKPGRRLQLAEAEVVIDGRAVVRARAVLLRRGRVSLPAGATDDEPPPGGPPELATRSPFPAGGEVEGFHRTGMELRFAGGTDYGPGPALAWFRFARPLVEGEEPSPVARAAAAADFGNGVSRILDFERHLFVNTDLSIHLHREPRGEWVLLDARTRIEPIGIGLAVSQLYDADGPLGIAAQSLFVEDR
jgi:hypothetical protein